MGTETVLRDVIANKISIEQALRDSVADLVSAIKEGNPCFLCTYSDGDDMPTCLTCRKQDGVSGSKWEKFELAETV